MLLVVAEAKEEATETLLGTKGKLVMGPVSTLGRL